MFRRNLLVCTIKAEQRLIVRIHEPSNALAFSTALAAFEA